MRKNVVLLIVIALVLAGYALAQIRSAPEDDRVAKLEDQMLSLNKQLQVMRSWYDEHREVVGFKPSGDKFVLSNGGGDVSIVGVNIEIIADQKLTLRAGTSLNADAAAAMNLRGDTGTFISGNLIRLGGANARPAARLNDSVLIPRKASNGMITSGSSTVLID